MLGFRTWYAAQALSSLTEHDLREDGPPIANTKAQDDAPDIYETPDLTDDTSTVPVRLNKHTRY